MNKNHEAEGAVSDEKTIERSGLISFREVKSLLEKAVRKGRAVPDPSAAGKGQLTSVEYFSQIFWKKTSGGGRVSKHEDFFLQKKPVLQEVLLTRQTTRTRSSS